MVEVSQGLVKLLLAGDTFCQIELASYFFGLVKQRDLMTTLCSNSGIGKSRRARTNNRNFLGRLCRHVVQQRFMTGSGINQTRSYFHVEGVIQTGLVAGNTGIDRLWSSLGCFSHELAVCQHGASHGNQVGISTDQHFLSHIRHINSVRRNNGN